MILTDTSIWIEFLRQNPVYVPVLQELLKKRGIITIEPIFSVLLFGARNDKERKIILSYWNLLPKLTFTTGGLLSAADYANRNNFNNLDISIIDAVIIKAVVENNCKIWTLDERIGKWVGREYLYK